MEQLPVEIILLILQFLPPEDWLRIKRLSRSFNGIISKYAKNLQELSVDLRVHEGDGPTPTKALTATMGGIEITVEGGSGGVQLVSRGAKEQRFFDKFMENATDINSFVKNIMALQPKVKQLVMETDWHTNLEVFNEIIIDVPTVHIMGEFRDFFFLDSRRREPNYGTLLINRIRVPLLLLNLLPGVLGEKYNEIQLRMEGERKIHLISILNGCLTDVAENLKLTFAMLNYVVPTSTSILRNATLSRTDIANIREIMELPDEFQLITNSGLKMTSVGIERQASVTIFRFESRRL